MLKPETHGERKVQSSTLVIEITRVGKGDCMCK